MCPGRVVSYSSTSPSLLLHSDPIASGRNQRLWTLSTLKDKSILPKCLTRKSRVAGVIPIVVKPGPQLNHGMFSKDVHFPQLDCIFQERIRMNHFSGRLPLWQGINGDPKPFPSPPSSRNSTFMVPPTPSPSSFTRNRDRGELTTLLLGVRGKDFPSPPSSSGKKDQHRDRIFHLHSVQNRPCGEITL